MQGKKFLPNIACALLFAEDPTREFPGCKVRVLRYEGESEKSGTQYNVVKDHIVEGNIPTVISACDEIVSSQLREFSRLDDNGKFFRVPEYPKEVWYEAIVNACVHRSYGLRNMNVFVKIFDDRLVIESPGWFPPFVTPQNIYKTQHPRNPHLMWGLHYLNFVKCANEGTRRMRDAMIRMRLPHPEFEQADRGHPIVRVTLRNDIAQRRVWVDSDVVALIGEAKAKGLSQEDHRAVNFVAENGSINVSKLQRITGHSWKSSKRLLMRLVERQILKHVHDDAKDRDPEAHFVLRDDIGEARQAD